MSGDVEQFLSGGPVEAVVDAVGILQRCEIESRLRDRAAPQYLLHRPWARKLVEDLLHTRTGGNSPLLHRLGGRFGL